MDFNFFENNAPNGYEFLKTIDFEIPIRLMNILNNEHFFNEMDFYKRLQELTSLHTNVINLRKS